MGRSVAAVPHVDAVVSSLRQRKTWSVGLVIGHLTDQKDVVLHLAPTPIDGDDAAKTQSIMDVEDILITTHANQVNRMLPGGIDILGLFVLASADETKNGQSKLRQLLYALFKSHTKTLHRLQTKLKNPERVLLQIDSISGKCSCKTYDVQDQKAVSKPADWRLLSHASGGGEWYLLRTRIAVNHTFYVPDRDADDHFENQLLHGLEPLLNAVHAAVCVLPGKGRGGAKLLTSEDILLNELIEGSGIADSKALPRKAAVQPSGGGGRGKQPDSSEAASLQQLDVQFMLTSPDVSSCTKENSVARFTVLGVIAVLAYVSKKASVKEAVDTLKDDAVKSLVSRCQLLAEDFLQSESEKHEEAGPAIVYETPIRVLLGLRGWPAAGAAAASTEIRLCDYLFKDEKAEECVERVRELLGMPDDQFGAGDVLTTLERSADLTDLAKPLAAATETTARSLAGLGGSGDTANAAPVANCWQPRDYAAYLGAGAAAVAALAATVTYFLDM